MSDAEIAQGQNVLLKNCQNSQLSNNVTNEALDNFGGVLSIFQLDKYGWIALKILIFRGNLGGRSVIFLKLN